MNKSTGTAADDRDITHFTLRIAILSLLLTISGLMFIGIGAFRYTPHPIMHNVCAKGLTVIMGVLMLSLPWLAPRIPKVMSVISALAILICSAIGIRMLMGQETLTNLEALAGLLFLGWFIVFSRQIAAIEADRLHDQLMMLQAGTGDSTGAAPAIQPETRTAPAPTSRSRNCNPACRTTGNTQVTGRRLPSVAHTARRCEAPATRSQLSSRRTAGQSELLSSRKLRAWAVMANPAS